MLIDPLKPWKAFSWLYHPCFFNAFKRYFTKNWIMFDSSNHLRMILSFISNNSSSHLLKCHLLPTTHYPRRKDYNLSSLSTSSTLLFSQGSCSHPSFHIPHYSSTTVLLLVFITKTCTNWYPIWTMLTLMVSCEGIIGYFGIASNVSVLHDDSMPFLFKSAACIRLSDRIGTQVYLDNDIVYIYTKLKWGNAHMVFYSSFSCCCPDWLQSSAMVLKVCVTLAWTDSDIQLGQESSFILHP